MMEQQVTMEPQEPMELQAHRVQPEMTEPRELMAPLVHKEPPEV